MPIPQITITPAGFAAIVNAENTGTAPVKVTQVGLTAQHFDVGTVGASVPAEFKRLTTFGGKAVADDTLHLNVRDDGTDTYTLRGFGLYLQDGTLFAVYSQSTPIMEKAAAATLLLATDIRFAKINATSIEVGDIDFINPPATTTQMGVVRLATEQEADAGSDHATAITPRGLARYINNRFGTGAPSPFVKTLLGLATAAMFRVELGLKSAALRDEGHGNGLNADQLDGAHGDYYLDWDNFTGVPNRFTPAPHTHPIGEVDGLQPALDGKVNRAGDTFTGPLAVNGAMLRSYGWNGVASNGILVLGDTGSSIVKNGAYFDFTNSAGGYTATLSAGGTIWTSGNFDPAKKVNKAGDTMTGELATVGLRVGYPGNTVSRVFSDGTTVYYDCRGSYDGALPNAHACYRAKTHTWTRDDGVIVASLSNTGEYTVNGSAISANRCVRTNTGTAALAGYVAFHRLDGTRMGYVGWGDANRLQYSAENGFTGHAFVGTVAATGGFDFGSSRKLKDIDGPMPYGLAEVRRIVTLIGRYKPEYNDDGRTRLFFDAEQFMEVMPEVVDEQGASLNGEPVPSIKIEQVMPPAYRAITELADLVDELRAEVAALKAGC
ncbi:hypothetical protein D7U83_04065 [Stenotrophomonas maltophilia]|uniref:hypothetical protein n=1 Tax=Stenotrophomonas maltophilia group TaxID=995085 RepID=UPI0015E01390|nr:MULTISPECIES: hypothetical protein [Stenotrophomonas maltophilia group]MBA0399034.1 hypothetical protein [Stenotrophomonas maltophilia]